jgi:hypothetical protein
MKTNLYSLEDSNYIINYYKDILIGKEIGTSIKLKISEINTEKHENDRYRIICNFKLYRSFLLYQSIENVLDSFNLPQPSEILKNLNR